MRQNVDLETRIHELLADEQFSGHPLQEALDALFRQYSDHLSQIDRLTAISDGYQSVMRERNATLVERQNKQMRHLKKIIRISDHYQKMLRDANNSLKVASSQDPLTGLPNRRLMLERLAAENALAERHNVPYSLALIDIDHFKAVNDHFGHDAGDRILVHVAHLLANSLRPYDSCARWGGEEFIVLLPRTDFSRAYEIAERLRSTLRHSTYRDPSGADLPTLSIGLAQFESGVSFEQVIKKADTALYRAKHSGRDRSMAFG